jgi:hypothetical protein
MSVIFYPHDDDVAVGSVSERLEILMEGAERFKAAVLDAGTTIIVDKDAKKSITPKEITLAFNWQEISRIMREIRELPESSQTTKVTKAERLRRLSEIYEVLRAAKMPKLEAVRIALMNECNQLVAGGSSSTG